MYLVGLYIYIYILSSNVLAIVKTYSLIFFFFYNSRMKFADETYVVGGLIYRMKNNFEQAKYK